MMFEWHTDSNPNLLIAYQFRHICVLFFHRSKNLDKIGRIVYLVTYENGEIVEKMVAQGVDYYGKVDGMGDSLPGSLICNGLVW